VQNVEILHVKLVAHNVITGLYSDSLHAASCSTQAASIFLTAILRYKINLIVIFPTSALSVHRHTIIIIIIIAAMSDPSS